MRGTRLLSHWWINSRGSGHQLNQCHDIDVALDVVRARFFYIVDTSITGGKVREADQQDNVSI